MSRSFSGDWVRLTTVVLLTAFLGTGAGSVNAQIYKYTDENGIVHYSSKPPKTSRQVETFRFPCYASDTTCSGRLDWEKVPLDNRAFASEIREAARLHRVDEALIRAVIHAESAYQSDALSPKGAQGLMQLMPATQQELEIPDAFDPALNIEGGTRYLAGLLEQFDGDVELASAAYNAGPGAVQRYRGVPPFLETREYVKRVKILHRRYRLSDS